jgi:hypothetical protein
LRPPRPWLLPLTRGLNPGAKAERPGYRAQCKSSRHHLSAHLRTGRRSTFGTTQTDNAMCCLQSPTIRACRDKRHRPHGVAVRKRAVLDGKPRHCLADLRVTHPRGASCILSRPINRAGASHSASVNGGMIGGPFEKPPSEICEWCGRASNGFRPKSGRSLQSAICASRFCHSGASALRRGRGRKTGVAGSTPVHSFG